jgi:RNA polymerase sigma-70 factor (ECF subfamily)
MRQLFEDCVPHVYRFAVRLTGDAHRAEDLTQDVLLRAWRSRRDLRDPSAVRGWLLQITVNAWRDELRKQRAVPSHADVDTEMPCPRVVSPVSNSIQKEDVQRTLDALDDLPERQRSVVYLHVCEQMSLSEIAEVLAISYAAAKASLSAGRQQLRRKLRDVFSEADTVERRTM